MRRDRGDVPLGLGAERVREGEHVCLLYSEDFERLGVILAFLRSGQENGEALLYLVDAMGEEPMRSYLLEQRIGREEDEALLEVAGTTPAGADTFDMEATLSAFTDFHERIVVRGGWKGARLAGEMGRCFHRCGCADAATVLEFEARLTELLESRPCTVCCQYDARLLDGPTLIDVLSVHSAMIVRGQLVSNPFFVPPREYLRARRGRSEEAEE